MNDQVKPDSDDTKRLLEQAAGGDSTAFGRLLTRHRQPLKEFVEMKLDRNLRGRVDPSDVIQEAHVEAARRFDDYLDRPPMPFHLWLRKNTYEQLVKVHRRHAQAERRDVRREVPLPERSSVEFARQLIASGSTPSRQISARETARQVRRAIAQLPDTDREVLLMRSFEGATYDEIAYVMNIQNEAAKKRHGRALLRLHKILIHLGITESEP